MSKSSPPRGDEQGGLTGYLREHARVLLFTLGRLWRSPGGTLLTAAAIGITLALPAGLRVLLENAHVLSYSWESSVQASLFLKSDVTEAEGRALAHELSRKPGVADTSYITRDQALDEFRQLSGFGNALDVLRENPLPAVVVVKPEGHQTPEAINQLIEDLGEIPQVDQARLDTAWLQRLYAILDIAQLGLEILAVLLGLAVIITVGNTIRLDIQSRRDEIVVLKLIGASDGFIRRPFLYTGACYGLLGAILAWALIGVGLWLLSAPVSRLAALYHSQFRLAGLGFVSTLTILGAGMLLGWLGSWWTVARHLGEIEPQ
jgi:cell division transport system permease protein